MRCCGYQNFLEKDVLQQSMDWITRELNGVNLPVLTSCWAKKCAAKYADEIIVLSEGVKQYFQDTYGRETRFIPNGVNRPEIKSAELITEKYGLIKRFLYFIFRIISSGKRYSVFD